MKGHEAETMRREDSVAEPAEPKGPHPPFGHPLPREDARERAIILKSFDFAPERS